MIRAVTSFVLALSGGVCSGFLRSCTSTDQYTLALGMFQFISGQYTQSWGVFSAAALVGALPIVVVFFALQRQLLGGLTAGGVKG